MLSPIELIIKKRTGKELSSYELDFLVNSYIDNKLPDYQMAAFLMAVFFQGMNDREIQYLTEAYIQSGNKYFFDKQTVDKHSTGGIGDKVSLMLAPIVAECGAYIPMISGRGLGHTGGTLDKLESIKGFKTDLSQEEFRNTVETVGFSIISQSNELVPADKKIYALRDVSGTVESLPLITASILSKKIAEGAKNLVIDLKVGTGAFISNIDQGNELGRLLKSTSEALGQKTEIVLSNMNSPLGYYVGNGVEVYEAIQYLKGKKIPDLDELTKHLAVKMLILSKNFDSEQEAKRNIDKAITSGKALERFARFIKAQGGDDKVCEKPQLLPQAKYILPIKAKETGWVRSIDGRNIGYSLMHIDSGRKNLDSIIDHSTGIKIKPKVGDYINKNDIIGKVFCNNKEKGTQTANIVTSSYFISENKVSLEKIILKNHRGEHENNNFNQ